MGARAVRALGVPVAVLVLALALALPPLVVVHAAAALAGRGGSSDGGGTAAAAAAAGASAGAAANAPAAAAAVADARGTRGGGVAAAAPEPVVLVAGATAGRAGPPTYHQQRQFVLSCLLRRARPCIRVHCPEGVPSFGGPGPRYLAVWDRVATAVFGRVVSRGRDIEPCIDRCLNLAHVRCTVENEEVIGGDHTFQFMGRLPLRRVFVFEETASACGSLLTVAVAAHSLVRFRRVRAPPSYPFIPLFRGYFVAVAVASVAAFLFHTKQTPLTERLDYYCAFVGVVYILYSTVRRVFWVVRPAAVLALRVAAGVLAVFHLFRMEYVHFDYARHQRVAGAVVAAHSFTWLFWAVILRKRHSLWSVVPNLGMIVASFFEGSAFRPLWLFVDGHSLWHFAIAFAQIGWTEFLLRDAAAAGDTLGADGTLPHLKT